MTTSQTLPNLNRFFFQLSRLTGAKPQDLRRDLAREVHRLLSEAIRNATAQHLAEQTQSRWAHEVSSDPDRRGYFRLFRKSKSTHYQPLERAISYASNRTGRFPYQTAIIMTHFFEAIADEVSKGHQVRLPGFGMFTPYAYGLPSREVQSQPRFVPARTFRGQVRRLLPVQEALKCNQRAESYRRSHHPSSQKERPHDSVPLSMQWLRGRIHNEGGVLADGH